jgi:hypothetical protein
MTFRRGIAERVPAAAEYCKVHVPWSGPYVAQHRTTRYKNVLKQTARK